VKELGRVAALYAFIALISMLTLFVSICFEFLSVPSLTNVVSGSCAFRGRLLHHGG
jgi:hypothetical protein